MLIPEIVYALFCIFWAYLNYIIIERLDDEVKHWFNGLMHLSVCIFSGFAIHFLAAITMLLIGRLFFDVSLNIFRMGWRNIGYVPRYPKSIIDKIEKKVFGKDGITPKIIYTALIALLNIVYIVL
jgi:hypothetical protein